MDLWLLVGSPIKTGFYIEDKHKMAGWNWTALQEFRPVRRQENLLPALSCISDGQK